MSQFEKSFSKINDNDFSSIQRCFEINLKTQHMTFESEKNNRIFEKNQKKSDFVASRPFQLFYFIRSLYVINQYTPLKLIVS